jgi:hypothetical protein
VLPRETKTLVGKKEEDEEKQNANGNTALQISTAIRQVSSRVF